jgi:hypothetical protein
MTGGRKMQVSRRIGCQDFPCADVTHECYAVPNVRLTPGAFSIAMISEAAPPDPSDYFHAKGEPLFAQTTVQAFRDAGAEVSSVKEIMRLGVYLTTAVKCGKTAYGIKAATIKECSSILEKELALFPNLRALMLMGDVAIKAVNYIARRAGEDRVIPAGSTYKIRGQAYYFRGMRVFPSYLQAGPSFFIEKSKRRMIAEDIGAALALVR